MTFAVPAGKYMSAMADETKIAGGAMPTLEDWQHWTLVMGRAQQMLMEFWAESLKKDQPFPAWSPSAFGFPASAGARRGPDGADERGRAGLGQRPRRPGARCSAE